jgi:hypothetical protein
VSYCWCPLHTFSGKQNCLYDFPSYSETSLIWKTGYAPHYEDVHGADPSDVRDWVSKDEGDFEYKNPTEEETAQQAEEDGSREDEKKVET